MADEQKPATNVEAEKDVQNVLNELKAENGSEKVAQEEEKVEEKVEEKAEEKAEEKVAQEDPEEARIVAAAAKLGEKSEQSQQSGEKTQPQQESRGPYRSRNAAKFDPSTLEETDDPVEIRKQV